MPLLFQREQAIFDHLWANANHCIHEMDGRQKINSKQVEALAKALAVELAGLERKIEKLAGEQP